MIPMEEALRAAGEVVGFGMVIGFAVSAFLVLATEGICSLVHLVKKAF